MPPAAASRLKKVTRRGSWFDYEQRAHPLLPWPDFLRRMLVNLSLGLGLIMLSLLAGMLGYHTFEGLGGLDSFLNASMILSGMGPLWSPQTGGGKLFAGLYALFSGIAVLAIAGVIFAPLVHRLMHRFHAADDDDSVGDSKSSSKTPRFSTQARKR